MKKSYVGFVVILAVLILAFSFTRSYLNSLEDAAKGTRTDRSAATLDSIQKNLNARLDRMESTIDARLDSLEMAYRSSQLESDTIEKSRIDSSSARLVSSSPKATPKPKDSLAKETSSTLQTDPSERDRAIYSEYLKMRWALPGDLNDYELKLAKADLLETLAKKYELTTQEILDIVDKVYESRRKKDKN